MPLNRIQEQMLDDSVKYKLNIKKGTTAERPTTNLESGFQYFDTTLNKPIWRNALNDGWVDSTGTAV